LAYSPWQALLRLFAAPADPEFAKSKLPRFAFIRSPYAIIDLAAILPFYLALFIPLDLRVLRLLRLLRLLKLLRAVIPAIQEFAKANRGRTFRQQVFAFADSARSYSVVWVFFPFRFTVFVTVHTLTHLRPGPSGVTGFMGSLLDLMRRNWGC
jgi:hypothetical protein